MTRMIDADALNEKLCRTTIFIRDGERFQRMINEAPTIEPDGDLISRSRAIKDVSEWATDILHPDRIVKEDAIHILESLPPSDAVEVVRCKDCRCWNGSQETMHNNHLCRNWSKSGIIYTSADDFCSFAERREPCAT